MSQIYGDPEAIKRAEEARAGDKSVYVNMEAIRELPDEYEAVITEVEFDPQNLKADFSDVGGGNWMPQTQLMYDIAGKCGISGGDRSVSKPIIEEVDINPMLMRGMADAPTARKMTVGRSVTKFSTKMQEDGTVRPSSACTSEYNVWDRCLEQWAKEEEDTDGYDEKKVGTFPSGDKYFTRHWTKNNKAESKKIALRYDTMYKRRAHFQGEMKFAHAKCETKAHTKTIRELAGLTTGYSAEDLKTGKLTFAKIRRSRESIKAEAAARLTAISRAGSIGQDPTALLFGPQDTPAPETAEVVVPEEEAVATEEEAVVPAETTVEFIVPPTEPEKSKRDQLLAILKIYSENGMVVPTYVDASKAMIGWLEANEDAEDNEVVWAKAVGNLGLIEEKIPEEGRITHTIH